MAQWGKNFHKSKKKPRFGGALTTEIREFSYLVSFDNVPSKADPRRFLAIMTPSASIK